MKNVIIIGNGPAGISAALYTARANIHTTIIGKDVGALEKATSIENYYGLSKPISGKELVLIGIKQAKAVGANFIEDEVVSLGYEDKFVVKTKNQLYKSDALVISTGVQRAEPKIKGLEEYKGKGISYCASCDAFFYKGKDVAVLGGQNYALNEAKELLPIAKSVTLLTNGGTTTIEIPKDIKINTKEVYEFVGEDGVISGVLFSDNTRLPISGIFIAMGTAGSTDLAKKIGINIEKRKIIVDSNMQTNIPGIYAAGDCTGGLLQISKAVYEGAKAGTEVIKYLRNL